MNIGTLVVSLGIDATGLYSGEVAMARFGKNSMRVVNDLNGSLKQLSMSLRMFGWLATTVLTAPFIMFGKSVFSAFQEYEFTMKKIQALTNSSAEEVKNWTSEVLKMGGDLARPPQELAEALYYITSSGIAGAEAMNVLAISAKAASAGLGETQKIADLVTSALNAYRGTGLTAANVGNYLVAGVREGKAEAEGFATALGSIIPISSKLGLSLDQVVGGMAAITLTGASAANAATYLRNMLQKMIHPSAMSEKMLKKMGSSSAELRNLIRQPNGLMMALSRLKELTDEWGIESLGKAIPNIRGMLAFLSLMGKNMEYNQGIMDRMKNSTDDLDEAFAIASTTVKFRMNSAMSSLKAGMISFGSSISTAVLPIIENLVKRFNNMVTWFNSLDESTKRTGISVLALAAALGPVSLLFSVFLSGINMAVKVVLGLAEAFTWLRVAMISNPWIAVATGVVAIVGALVHFRKKAIESASANDVFNKALVEIQGTIKKLKDTSETDFNTMTIAELAYAKTVVQSQYAIAQARLVSSESARKQEGWFNNLFGAQRQFDKYQDSEIAKKKQLKLQYDSILKSMDAWGKQWEKNALLSQVQMDLGGQEDSWSRIEEEINKSKKALDEYAEKLQEINRELERQENNRIKGGVGTNFEGLFKNTRLQKARGGPESEFEKNINSELAKQAYMNSLVGDSYDNLSSQIQIYTRALSELYDMEKQLGVKSPLVGQYEGILKGLQSMQEQGLMSERDYLDKKYAMDIASAEKTGRDTSLITFKYNKAINELRLRDIESYLSSASEAISTVTNLIEASKERELALAGNNARRREKIEREYMQKQKMWAIAQAVINGALAVTNLIANVKGSVLNPATWVAIATATAATAAQIAIISSQKMKEGGVVPPGYPNDTYPALLSSGERVTPPGRLDNLEQGGVVEFKIKDDYLYGILERRGRKVKSYA